MAFCTALGLAVGVVAVFGANSQGFRVALQATARINLLLFSPAYVGGALTALVGKRIRPLRDNSRNFGLAFAAALNVHLGLLSAYARRGTCPMQRPPEFWGEVQPPASLKGLDIPPRRAVFVPWKPSRRPAFGMGNPTFR